MNTIASAPGKLFLFGEYAVLEGHLALVAAVDKRANVRFVPGGRTLRIGGSLFSTPIEIAIDALSASGPASRVIAGVLAARELGARVEGGELAIDSRPLFEGQRKLGFGSSAAVCVATFAAICAASGTNYDKQRAFVACRDWHNRAQGTHGSGGDIAASLLGGLACLRGSQVSRLDWVPPLAVLFHPQSASTPAFISNVKRLKSARPEEYARHTSGLGSIANRARAAAEARDSAAWVALVREAEAALDAFDRVSDTDIVTEYQREVSRQCDALGGASKPAGAGGGDVSLVCAPDPSTLERMMRTIEATGGRCEILKIAPEGASAT